MDETNRARANPRKTNGNVSGMWAGALDNIGGVGVANQNRVDVKPVVSLIDTERIPRPAESGALDLSR
jgi:hypothetical protein